MADTIINLIIRGDDQGAGEALEHVTGQVSGLGGVLQTAGGFALGGLVTSGINAITGSLGGLVEGMVGGNAQFENYETQFQVMLGSADAAQDRIAELAAFGASTPFELPGVVEADRVLQGFGLHSEESAAMFGFSGEQIRTIAGDVASGTGTAFGEMAGLIGRFSAGATGEAISRMQELGITSRAELAGLGLEFSNSGQLLSPLPEAMNVVLGLMEDKYGGMMQAQSTTFSGMMSNIQDWKAGTLRTLGEPIFEVLKDKLGDTLAFLGSPEVQASISTFAQTLATGIGTAVDWLNTTGLPAIQTFVGWIRDNMSTIMPIVAGVASAFAAFSVISTIVGWISGLVAAFGAVSGAITAAGGIVSAIVAVLGGPLTIAIGAIALVVGGLTLAWTQNWGDIQGKTQGAVTFIQGVISSTLAAIQGWWAAHGAQVISTVQNLFSTTQNTVSTVIGFVANLINSTLAGIQSWWQAHGDSVMTIVGAFMSFASNVISTQIAIISTIINTVLSGVQAFWQAHGDTIMAVANTAWTFIKDSVQVAVNLISGIIDAFAFAVEGDWTAFGTTLRTTFQNAWDAIGQAVQTAVASIVQIVAGLILDIITRFTSTDWGALGRGIIEGIASAISGGVGAITSAAQNAAEAALNAAMGFLGISSPSRVAAERIGKPFAEGIGIGAQEELPNTQRLIQRSIGSELVPQRGGFAPTLLRPQPTGGQTVVHHTYHVRIEDTRAMALFLDYLENVSGKAALEAIG
jgi:phage-related protein